MSETSLKAYNPETQRVMDTLEGKYTQKQIIQNFFGLREQVIIAEDGKSILEVFDEFKDPLILEEKGVEWNEKLAKLGVQKEYFDTLLGKYLTYGQKDRTESNGSTDTLEGVGNSEKPTRGRKKKSE